jgi:membrane protein implicated in regulation of membrane protease activity
MLYVYLFATVLGGVLLGVSAVAGGDHDADAGGFDHAHDTHGAWGILSLRLWTYLLGFGGLTGLLLTTLTGTAAPVTALLAGGVGVASGVSARAVIRRALRSGGGGTLQQKELVGRSAEVLVPITRGTTGMIRLTVKNQLIDVMATCDEGELSPKDEVLIVDVDAEGQALVTRNPAAPRQLSAAAARAKKEGER